MRTIFDIFKRLPDGKPLWIEAVEGLAEARAQLHRLANATPGEYFIYSERKGGVIERHSSMRQGECAA
jgi:hypothetical protein